MRTCIPQQVASNSKVEPVVVIGSKGAVSNSSHTQDQPARNEPARQDRPRNRKQLIVAAAARLFEGRGYHNVAITDIAAEVGITGPALYRHFRRKQDLLEATIEFEIGQLKTTYQNASQELRAIVEAAAETTLRYGHAATLWEREIAHLEQHTQDALRERYREAIAPLRGAIEIARPELDAEAIDLLLWAAHAVFCSRRVFDSADIDAKRARELMVDAVMKVCAAQGIVAPIPASALRPRGGMLMPASRREAALGAAVALFAERGYQAVGMDDIGAAAGITGPTLYHHFPGKSAILVTAISRCLEAMYLDLSAALASTDDPALALDRAVASFIRINIEHGDAMSALTMEIMNLPAEERGAIRRRQRDYITEWATLLISVRSDLTVPEAELTVRMTQRVIHNLRRVYAGGNRSGLRDQLVVLGRAALGLPSAISAPDA